MRVLTDDDVRAHLEAGTAVTLMREMLVSDVTGDLVAPPRVQIPLGGPELVVTAGARPGQVHGFRAYVHPGPAGPDQTISEDQVVAVWDEASADLVTLVLGRELGARRTGALGGAAIDVLARPEARTLGVIGTGLQAFTQVWAATAVRTFDRVRVYSRSADNREGFAARCRDELGLDVVTVDEAGAAVEGTEVVILATDSTRPVIEAEWIAPGTHVSTLGPRFEDAHELPAALVDRALVHATDAPAQVAASTRPALVAAERLTPLGAVIAGLSPGRSGPHDVTLYVSAGLAGTEVALASALAATVAAAT